MNKLLIVDDEDKFREILQKHLELRGFASIALSDGRDAVKTVKGDPDIDVVILDRKMPGISGEQVLKEIKEFRPELQVIFLTGHGSVSSAMEVGKYDAYTYLEKPCDIDRLIEVIEAARADAVHAMERHEIPHVEKGSVWKWFLGTHNSRPGIMILGLLIFLGIIFVPAPRRMNELLTAPKTEQITDPHLGYAYYSKMKSGETIADYYARSSSVGEKNKKEGEKKSSYSLSAGQAAFRAKVMLGTLVLAALFWASGAVPVGITALLVGGIMYLMDILKPDDIAQAYAKDAVIFIFGVLAVSKVISKTGLDRRIGLLLLGPVKSLPRFLFIFLPLMGISCAFISEHALVAFIMPMLILVYMASTQREGLKSDKALATLFVLSLCYAANCGGPGSPAAGGRNAVMLGILTDYGSAPSFVEWVKYGLPFVPVMGLVIGLYFYLALGKRIKVKQLNASKILKQASNKIGPMDKKEYITAIVLIGLILLWITSSDVLGMGGPVLLALIALNIFRILRWKDITGIHWEVVALYASACALGKGLAVTGAALFMADGFIGLLPDFMSHGEGLAVAVSLFTGITTNFMSDGATVSAIGPITVPMATISNTHPWMIGLATAFASSFAHMLIIGTPNNAIAYAMAKDPVTGEQLVTLGDFLKHGAVVLLLSLVVLWLWVFFGYWRIIGF
ncbi:anion permease [bacterium]|nr:anion permease [FCB group bacterium]MBL7191463.1 anion permease [bacterium]